MRNCWSIRGNILLTNLILQLCFWNWNLSSFHEIRDLLEYNPPQPFSTSAVLNYCQRKMILPYTRLLGLLGLRPLLGDFNDQTLALSAINKIHLFLVTCFLIFGYVMQLFTCYRYQITNSIYQFFKILTLFPNDTVCLEETKVSHISNFLMLIFSVKISINIWDPISHPKHLKLCAMAVSSFATFYLHYFISAHLFKQFIYCE